MSRNSVLLDFRVLCILCKEGYMRRSSVECAFRRIDVHYTDSWREQPTLAYKPG